MIWLGSWPGGSSPTSWLPGRGKTWPCRWLSAEAAKAISASLSGPLIARSPFTTIASALILLARSRAMHQLPQKKPCVGERCMSDRTTMRAILTPLSARNRVEHRGNRGVKVLNHSAIGGGQGRDPSNRQNTWTGHGRMPRWLCCCDEGRQSEKRGFPGRLTPRHTRPERENCSGFASRLCHPYAALD